MRCEIVDIGKGDSFRNDRRRMVGQKGTFATIRIKDKGFCSGIFYPDDFTSFYISKPYSFCKLKTKPIYDDSGLSQ